MNVNDNYLKNYENKCTIATIVTIIGYILSFYVNVVQVMTMMMMMMMINNNGCFLIQKFIN